MGRRNPHRAICEQAKTSALEIQGRKPGVSTTRLFLLRHGATVANESRPYVLQGRGVNHPLSATGREQAAAASRLLSRYPLAAVYASPLRRAMETAECIAAAHRHPVVPVDALAECDVGRWEGLDWDTVMRDYAEAYAAFMADPATVGYLGGESYADVLSRAAPAMHELLERHEGETIAVVAHNVVNRVLLADLLGLDLKRARDLSQANCCVNVIRRRDGKAQVVTLNATFHLDDKTA